MQLPTADYWIEKLQLTAHVEGGAFRELYKSSLTAPSGCLPAAFTGDRSFSTSIYFMLQNGQFSAFHRIQSDEIWHFYYGDPLVIYEIDQSGQLTKHLLGNDPEQGASFQHVITAGNWFAARILPGGNYSYSLVGCTVSPGFDFADFELANRTTLINLYPAYEQLIKELTLEK